MFDKDGVIESYLEELDAIAESIRFEFSEKYLLEAKTSKDSDILLEEFLLEFNKVQRQMIGEYNKNKRNIYDSFKNRLANATTDAQKKALLDSRKAGLKALSKQYEATLGKLGLIVAKVLETGEAIFRPIKSTAQKASKYVSKQGANAYAGIKKAGIAITPKTTKGKIGVAAAGVTTVGGAAAVYKRYLAKASRACAGLSGEERKKCIQKYRDQARSATQG